MQSNEQMLDYCRAAMKTTVDLTTVFIVNAERLCAIQAQAVREACSLATEARAAGGWTPLEFFTQYQAQASEIMADMVRRPD